jgi:hypothetical protein
MPLARRFLIAAIGSAIRDHVLAAGIWRYM